MSVKEKKTMFSIVIRRGHTVNPHRARTKPAQTWS